MEIFKIIGVAFITSIAAILLKGTKPELSFAVTVTGVIVILLFIINSMQNVLGVFAKLAQISGVENGMIKLIIKIVGVGYLTEFAAGVLNDFGSGAIADKVVLGGKIAILLLSLPVLEGLLEVTQGFLRLI